MPTISDKSSIGFHRPKSFVVNCWPARDFLFFFALPVIDFMERLRSAAAIANGFVLRGIGVSSVCTCFAAICANLPWAALPCVNLP